MLPISGLYEVALRVKDLRRAETFYREILGLDVGLRDERRPWVFLRAGGQAGMVVLQEDHGAWPVQHVAFTVAEADIDRAAELLRAQGIAVRGPVLISWMPAKSVYFADPDGHALELCAPLRPSSRASSVTRRTAARVRAPSPKSAPRSSRGGSED